MHACIKHAVTHIMCPNSLTHSLTHSHSLSLSLSSHAKAVGLTATGIILPALVVAAVAVGIYLAYRHWKK